MRETYVAELVTHLMSMGLQTALLDTDDVAGVRVWVRGHCATDPDTVVLLYPTGLAMWGKDQECSAKGLTPLELAYAIIESVGGHGPHCD